MRSAVGVCAETSVQPPGSFDDLRHHDHIVPLRRGVTERRLDRQAAAGDIVGPDVFHWKGVSGRLDAGDVDFSQLLDVVQDIAELLRKPGFFLGGQGDAREVSDVINVEGGRLGHCRINAKAWVGTN